MSKDLNKIFGNVKKIGSMNFFEQLEWFVTTAVFGDIFINTYI